jgi:hypothetical protein
MNQRTLLSLRIICTGDMWRVGDALSSSLPSQDLCIHLRDQESKRNIYYQSRRIYLWRGPTIATATVNWPWIGKYDAVIVGGVLSWIDGELEVSQSSYGTTSPIPFGSFIPYLLGGILHYLSMSFCPSRFFSYQGYLDLSLSLLQSYLNVKINTG